MKSSTSQSKFATSAMRTGTAAGVHTSVSRCLPSAMRVIDRWCRPTQEARADSEIDQRCPGRPRETDAGLIEGHGIHEPLDGGPYDEAGCDEDHRPFDGGRELLRLAVAEVVQSVARSDREEQRKKSHDGSDEVQPDSSASERKPTDPVSAAASALRAIVATAAAIDAYM
jgi:hypothetical protein